LKAQRAKMTESLVGMPPGEKRDHTPLTWLVGRPVELSDRTVHPILVLHCFAGQLSRKVRGWHLSLSLSL
jgi:hypothetical protein